MGLKLDKLDTHNQGELTKPTLVLCEGKRDASFVLHLMEQRGITGIQVGFPDEITSNAFGSSGFKEYLVKLRARTGFKNVQRIVILRDRNGSEVESFQDVVQQVHDATKYEIPAALEAETAGVPSLTVRLIPDSTTEGNLDVLLLSAVDPLHPLNHCFDPYFRCCNLHTMPVGKAAKIKLTSIIAGHAKAIRVAASSRCGHSLTTPSP